MNKKKEKKEEKQVGKERRRKRSKEYLFFHELSCIEFVPVRIDEWVELIFLCEVVEKHLSIFWKIPPRLKEKS